MHGVVLERSCFCVYVYSFEQLKEHPCAFIATRALSYLFRILYSCVVLVRAITILKGLISVGKDPKTSKVHVSSVACKLNGGEGMFDFFPVPYHPQNFCYLVVNPTKREATVLYHAWCGD